MGLVFHFFKVSFINESILSPYVSLLIDLQELEGIPVSHIFVTKIIDDNFLIQNAMQVIVRFSAQPGADPASKNNDVESKLPFIPLSPEAAVQLVQ